MNDRTIINIISKIHFILISALSFIFLSSFFIFILLQNGIYLDDISIANIKAKKLYIKYNTKINFIVKELSVSKSKSNSNTPADYTKTINTLHQLKLFNKWFEQVSIENIKFDDIEASFIYTEGKDGFIKAKSNDFRLNSTLSFEPDMIHIQVKEFHENKKDIRLDGDIVLNYKNKFELSTDLNLNVHNDIKLKIYTLANEKKFYYKLNSLKDIKSIKHTVDLFNLDDRVKYWISDAIEMQDLRINSAFGFFEYDKMDEAVNNIDVKAVAHKLNYTYNQKIASVYTDYTNLEFKKGVLFIRPENTYSYGIDLDESWLKIDFSNPQEILTLHLLFDGMLNNDMLYILDTYGIKLPILQTQGVMDTNLTLVVNLRTIDVDARGKFKTKKAKINYLGLGIDVFDVLVNLNNFDIIVQNMYAQYGNIAKAKVGLDFNAKNLDGEMSFNITEVNFDDLNLTLAQNNLNVIYKISPKQDYININKSEWKFKNKQINLNKLNIPFDLENLKATIPSNNIKVDNILKAKLAGEITLKPINADIDIVLESFDFNGLTLNQDPTKIKLKVDNGIDISVDGELKLKKLDNNFRLNNINLNIKDNKLSFNNLFIDSSNILNSKISSYYDLANNIGTINIHNINFASEKFGEIFQNTNSSNVAIKKVNNKTSLHSNEFDIDFIVSDDDWKLSFNSLKKFSRNSKLLQKYKLNDGNLVLYNTNNEPNSKILANINYPYKIIVIDNKPVQNYTVNGLVHNNAISMNINDSVKININENINIQASDIGIDTQELLKIFANDDTAKDEDTSIVNFNANNCYIYFSKDRHALSDTIELQYNNGVINAQFSHKKGMAWLELIDGNFRLHGNNFDDEFMENIFALSKFERGTLEFSMIGKPNEYDGVMYVQNTTIHDYVLLNNILAFVNTIPSLVTFSLPGYNKDGLKVKNAYLNFKYKDELYKISDISLNSKEISIVGKGEASVKNNLINLDLNIKTDIGSSVAKIPLLGYILLDEDTLSASLRIKGKLNDPEVKTRLVKDIVVAPLNIIKRTFLLPYNILKGDK